MIGKASTDWHSSIRKHIGLNGGSDEIDLLERRIDALNKRMLDLVTLSIKEDNDAENYEDEFKSISQLYQDRYNAQNLAG